jgi:transposase
MRRFVEQADREQSTVLPERLDDFIDECNTVRVIDVSVDTLDLAEWVSTRRTWRRRGVSRSIRRFARSFRSADI